MYMFSSSDQGMSNPNIANSKEYVFKSAVGASQPNPKSMMIISFPFSEIIFRIWDAWNGARQA